VVDGGVPSIKILLVQQDGMGKANALKAVASALDNFDVGIITCIGIAGSLSVDMRLGDVCYSGSVIDVYENSKASDKDGRIILEFSPTHYDTPKKLPPPSISLEFCPISK
jgi:nucleoside phosphorylase